MTTLAPDYIYTSQGLQPNMLISLTTAGRIASIERREDGEEPDAQVERLPGVGLRPGFVNAHSHVFQRA